MELITARQGKAHITPMQDAMWHRGLTGMDSCIFNAFENFRADTINNNEIRIRSGVGMLQGRFFEIPPNTYDAAVIANGTQGQNRMDLIVCRITTNEAANTQKADTVVIQGTPKNGVVQVPAIETGDLDSGAAVVDYPLYRVYITGISIASVEPLFTTGWLSLDKLGGMGMELVWSNAAPGSAFGPQEIKVNLSKYSGIMILARNGVTAPMLTTLITYDRGDTSRIAVPGGVTAFRDFTVYVNRTGINFGEGREIPSYGAAASTNNTRCIPLKIYGILGKVE